MVSFGKCPYCGAWYRVNKNGKIYRHGFIRVRKGFKRVAFPDIPSGTDGKPCPGTGQVCLEWLDYCEFCIRTMSNGINTCELNTKENGRWANPGCIRHHIYLESMKNENFCDNYKRDN